MRLVTRRSSITLSFLLSMVIYLSFGNSGANALSVEYVVFELSSELHDLAIGDVLIEGDGIEIPAETAVKLLSKTGEILVVTGPYVGVITNEDESLESSENGSSALKVISELIFKKKDLVNTLGAARSVNEISGVASNGATGAISPWTPRLGESGHYCLSANSPELLRADPGEFRNAILLSETGLNIDIHWPGQVPVFPVDPYVDESTESLNLLFTDQSGQYQLHLVDERGMSLTEQIAWMAEKGCHIQALTLLSVEAGLVADSR